MDDQQKPPLPSVNYAPTHIYLKQESHRRSATACRAPALVWHFGFWPRRIDDPQNAKKRKQFNRAISAWVMDHVNPFVARLHKAGSGGYHGSPPNFSISARNRDGSEKQIYTAGQSDVEFHIKWNGLQIGVRIELHADYVTGTFFTSLADAEDNEFRRKIIGHFASAGGSDPALAKASSDYLHMQVWEDFSAHIETAGGVDPGTKSFIPGEVFVNLRGVVLQVEDKDNVFISQLKSMSGYESPNEPRFDGVKARRLFKQHEHFIAKGGFDPDPREYIASLFLEKRALFISNLGSEPPRNSTQHDEPVIRYQLFVKQANSRELGRLIERINTLETLKIISLKDVDLIREAGTSIRLAGNELDLISEKLKDVATARGARRLERALTKLEVKLDEISRRPTGGLAYRVVRSDYYGDQFKRRLRTIKAEPLEYWQSYDLFVERRYYSTLDYIANTGRRIRRLRERLAATLETIQTTILVDLTRGVHSVQTSSQFQTALLFVIGFSTFFGELLEPVFNIGQNHPETFIQISSWLKQLIGFFGNLVSYPKGESEVPFTQTYTEYVRKCIKPEALSEKTRASINDVISFIKSNDPNDQDFCKSFYRFIGYVYGLLIAVLLLVLFFSGSVVSILRNVYRGAVSLFGLKRGRRP